MSDELSVVCHRSLSRRVCVVALQLPLSLDWRAVFFVFADNCSLPPLSWQHNERTSDTTHSTETDTKTTQRDTRERYHSAQCSGRHSPSSPLLSLSRDVLPSFLRHSLRSCGLAQHRRSPVSVHCLKACRVACSQSESQGCSRFEWG